MQARPEKTIQDIQDVYKRQESLPENKQFIEENKKETLGLFQTISYYDYAENFYHGFMAGLLLNIGGYLVRSNRESGNGRPDIVMTESKFRGRAMIMELKISDTMQGMEKKCEEALAQMEAQQYAALLAEDCYQPILKYAICFFKKRCMVKKAESQG